MHEPLPRPEDDDPALSTTLHQDPFRRMTFGQAADPLVTPHPAPPEATEDELTLAALSDPEAERVHHVDSGPTVWRFVFLLMVSALALAVVFWKR